MSKSSKRRGSVEKAADRLANKFRGFRWFTSVGIAQPHDILFLYVKSLRHEELKGLIEWEGFPVEIRKMGTIRLCKGRVTAKV